MSETLESTIDEIELEAILEELELISEIEEEELGGEIEFSPQYVPGPKGDTGEKGQDGTEGPMGPQGPIGPQGPEGGQGPMGAQGIQGQGFKISKTYLSIEDLEADTDPAGILAGEFAIINSVTEPDNGQLFLWDGSEYTFMVDLSGSQGVQGPQGPQGAQGIQGPQGAQGPQGIQGPVGATGAKGDTGAQGPVGPFLHPRDGFRIQEQFNTVLGTTGAGWIFTANSGQHTLNSSLTANRAGVISVRTGSSAISAPTVSLGSVAGTSISSVPYTWECELQIGNLSTVTEEFSLREGFGSVNTSAAFINGLWFEYNRLASGDFWMIKTISSAAGSTTNVLSVPVLADTWYILKIVINAAGTSAEFFINGASVGVITTNIPVGTSRPVLPIMQIIKSAGTTDRIMYLSWAVVGAGAGADWT